VIIDETVVAFAGHGASRPTSHQQPTVCRSCGHGARLPNGQVIAEHGKLTDALPGTVVDWPRHIVGVP
jgi:hypothetical protein